LALAGWLSGCTSDPPNVLEPGNAGAPGVKRFIACAPNTVIALPAELQSGTLTLHEQIDAYLHLHDREAQWLDLYESRQRWSEAVEAAKAQGQIEKAPAIFAQDLAKHYEFDAILIPSILLHNTRVLDNSGSWDSVQRRVRVVNAPKRPTGRGRSTLAEGIAAGGISGDMLVTSVHVLVLSRTERGSSKAAAGSGSCRTPTSRPRLAAGPCACGTRSSTPTRCARASRSRSIRICRSPMRIDRGDPRVAALAFAALCGIGCAGMRVKPASLDGWRAVDASGVRIVAQASASEVDALAQELAGFDAAFSFLLGHRIAPTGPATIVLIRDADLGHRMKLGGGVDGFALTNFDGSFVCAWLKPNPTGTRIVLFHEYTHLLLHSSRSAVLPCRAGTARESPTTSAPLRFATAHSWSAWCRPTGSSGW